MGKVAFSSSVHEQHYCRLYFRQQNLLTLPNKKQYIVALLQKAQGKFEFLICDTTEEKS